MVKSSLPPRFQRSREGEDRESLGRDVLGELRDSFPASNDRRDGPMSSSWAGVDRRRIDSSDSMHSKVGEKLDVEHLRHICIISGCVWSVGLVSGGGRRG